MLLLLAASLQIARCIPAEAGNHLPSGDYSRRIIEQWARRPLPRWEGQAAKVAAPRIALAKLLAGKDVNRVNSYLLEARPWSSAGSSWDAREAFGWRWSYDDRIRIGHRGDYDFSLATLTTILYLFGQDGSRLYPETAEHLLNVLLTECGGRPRLRAPRSLGLVRETENHVLMTESSRYLKNQRLHEYGQLSQREDLRYNNAENGLEEWLTGYLKNIKERGFHEFNSIPYEGYAVQALLNLEAFAGSEEIAGLARGLLDTLARNYAFGSLDFRRRVPFRRNFRMRGRDLGEDPLTAMIRVWCEADADSEADPPYFHQMIIAAALPYRPPGEITKISREKQSDYLLKLGHGRFGSPAVFSGGPGYLISAGGAGRGRFSEVAARETVLLLQDGAASIEDCFRLPGRGNPRSWNNTGVHRRLAAGNSPVKVPEWAEPAASGEGWIIYKTRPAENNFFIAVYNRENFGLLALFDFHEDLKPEEIISALVKANPSEEKLLSAFRRPGGGEVSYDTEAPPGTWVITSAYGVKADRNYDLWPPGTMEKTAGKSHP